MSTQHGESNPYAIIRSRYVTEKAMALQELHVNQSNQCVARCQNPKAVFLVHPRANKQQIAAAVDKIYEKHGVKVTKVNVINGKRKRRRVRGRTGFRPAYRKAIVTFSPGDQIDEA